MESPLASQGWIVKAVREILLSVLNPTVKSDEGERGYPRYVYYVEEHGATYKWGKIYYKEGNTTYVFYLNVFSPKNDRIDPSVREVDTRQYSVELVLNIIHSLDVYPTPDKPELDILELVGPVEGRIG